MPPPTTSLPRKSTTQLARPSTRTGWPCPRRNPMRVEQRIGRIDRIGQRAPVVEIVNYTIPGTVEEDVYRALADRIDLFDGLVGELQPILGAVESSFKAIYRQPRSERAKAVKA